MTVAAVSAAVAVVIHNGSSPNAQAPTTSTATTTKGANGAFRNVVAVGEAGMIGAPNAGWAMNGIGLYRSDDDGAHWLNITPPQSQDPVANVTALAFWGADRAWAVVSTNHFSAVFRSTDGGRSWIATHLTGCPSQHGDSNCGAPTSITFTDRLHGRLFAETGFTTGNILGTDDGGRTWHFVGAAPFDGPIVFADAVHGWGISDPSAYDSKSGQPTKAGGALFHTEDGGRSWRQITLPALPGLSAQVETYGLPFFFGHEGVVAAWLRTNPTAKPNVAIYTTNDAGRTWTGEAAPSDPAAAQYGRPTSPPLPFSASNPSTWVLFYGTHLVVTHDGGLHWTTSTVSPPIRFFYSVFLGAPSPIAPQSKGWALAQLGAVDPQGQGRGQANTPALVRTTDGGRTWHLLAPE